MSNDKKFRSSLFGYNKTDVYTYIDRLAREIEDDRKAKDTEITELKRQNKILIEREEGLSAKLRVIEGDRSFVANAIIKAEEKARDIERNALEESERKKRALELEIEKEKERLKDLRTQIIQLRTNLVSNMKIYENNLSMLVPDDIEPLTQEVRVTPEPEVEPVSANDSELDSADSVRDTADFVNAAQPLAAVSLEDMQDLSWQLSEEERNKLLK